MILDELYDAAVIGGGLAGLAAAIELKKKGHSVVLFEKEKYPFHKVCGEYISMESWNFLTSLGVPLSEMNLPLIKNLWLTAPNGNSFHTKLPLGGFGISRFQLDAFLAAKASEHGIYLAQQTKVEEVTFNEVFTISINSKNNPSKKINARTCIGAFGKRSQLDVKWQRNSNHHMDKKLDNFVGIKYHITSKWPNDVIGLHNFKNGYCGISKIENDKFCLCYLTTAHELNHADNSITKLEQTLLYKNPHLKNIFSQSSIVEDFPITISQINFNQKTLIEKHILMTGDAAGMITPLCGNGMSIALHTGKIAAHLTHEYLIQNISRIDMEDLFTRQWKFHFSKRLRTGRILQRFFGSEISSNLFVNTMKTFPFLSRPVVKMTHGEPF